MPTDNENARATYSIQSGDEAPAMLQDETTVNGVSLSSLDPMRGFYDRLVAEGNAENIRMARNLPHVVLRELGESMTVAEYKKHLIECGYGSRESVDKIWPEPAKEQKTDE